MSQDIDQAVSVADGVLVFASRPGRLVGSVGVGVARPRVETRSSVAFVRGPERDPRDDHLEPTKRVNTSLPALVAAVVPSPGRSRARTTRSGS